MSKPVIAANRPAKVALKAGQSYWFCRCGRSASQPFCDGSHKSTSFTPLAFTPEKDGEAYLCQCKRSQEQPYCDGSHARIPREQVGTTGEENSSPKPEGGGAPSNAHAAPRAEPTPEEPEVAFIHQLAREGLKYSHHGPMVAMGVPRQTLPQWDSIQLMVAQLARAPLLDDTPVATELVIGPEARKPLKLAMPLFVSDMSFGALSREAKIALAQGAEIAGTGICSGEGGMLDAEHDACSRYFYELAAARFGYDENKLKGVQAVHFKAGQAAKTGTGGHLPADKVTAEIAAVRGLNPGQAAISPARFADLTTPGDFRRCADHIREITGGVPIGFKLSANHIERDIQFALDASADYLILDGRGGGTGAAPALFRDNISVATIPALARARRYLDAQGRQDITLIITGGLRTPADFVKALALGADGIALANAAIQALGCVGARMCNTNRCPTGIATQDPALRQRLDVIEGPKRVARYLQSSTELMAVLARACGYHRLSEFSLSDLATADREMVALAGIPYAGVGEGGVP
ncbi:glutamate synthase-related protein [Ferrimonas balearica]|uniref:glutamate synthase-related protein n=1 Tax=Ferrimonas balearica TaxID=44012 RepID=UPI001C99EB0D|nr:glutamate synthase-related protein [Ferrimonas balearica]MBY5923260.1 CDGSH iron-sulfur domain-containing protein [Ferrimonas balearica]MBY5995218.1 CDGSH iron-sulfur domain-containing protein [Ferrimonas balearica]